MSMVALDIEDFKALVNVVSDGLEINSIKTLEKLDDYVKAIKIMGGKFYSKKDNKEILWYAPSQKHINHIGFNTIKTLKGKTECFIEDFHKLVYIK